MVADTTPEQSIVITDSELQKTTERGEYVNATVKNIGGEACSFRLAVLFLGENTKAVDTTKIPGELAAGEVKDFQVPFMGSNPNAELAYERDSIPELSDYSISVEKPIESDE